MQLCICCGSVLGHTVSKGSILGVSFIKQIKGTEVMLVPMVAEAVFWLVTDL